MIIKDTKIRHSRALLKSNLSGRGSIQCLGPIKWQWLKIIWKISRSSCHLFPHKRQCLLPLQCLRENKNQCRIMSGFSSIGKIRNSESLLLSKGPKDLTWTGVLPIEVLTWIKLGSRPSMKRTDSFPWLRAHIILTRAISHLGFISSLWTENQCSLNLKLTTASK